MSEAAILKQLEFYFSNSNFPNDKFLRSEAEKDPQGLVQADVLCSFARMKKLNATPELVAKVAKTSKVLKVSEDGTKVGRAEPVPDAADLKQVERTIYLKGWPETPEPSIEELEKFYSAYGKVQSVRLRRRRDKSFKGTALIEFSSESEAKAAFDAKPKVNDKDIIYMTAADWIKEKEEESKQFNKKENKDKKDKKEEPKEEKKEAPKEEPAAEKRKHDEIEEHGLVFEFEGVPENIKRVEIKAELAKQGDVQFVDYDCDVSQGKGYARFATAEGCKKVMEFLANNQLFGANIKTTLLEGTAEQEYYKKMNQDKENHKFAKRGRGGARGRGRGKRN